MTDVVYYLRTPFHMKRTIDIVIMLVALFGLLWACVSGHRVLVSYLLTKNTPSEHRFCLFSLAQNGVISRWLRHIKYESSKELPEQTGRARRSR